MKNVQVIDGAENCTYSLFAVTNEEFETLFPDGQDIAFIDEISARLTDFRANALFSKMWSRPVLKPAAKGIHGTLFYELDFKKIYYPTRKEVEVEPSAVNWAQRQLYGTLLAKRPRRYSIWKKRNSRSKG